MATTIFRDKQRLEIRDLVDKALQNKTFPGVEILAAQGEKIFFHEAFGNLDSSPESSPLKKNSLFDLASLTKPLATTNAALCLYESGLLDLNQKISDFIPDLCDPIIRVTSIKSLLTHTSGLPAWIALYEPRFDKKRAWEKLIRVKPENPPGALTVYSCLGFILLGELVRRVSKTSLSEFCLSRLFAPLKLNNLMFKPDASRHNNIVPTGYCPLRGELLRGIVYDENAYLFDQEGGNAGLFGTASDIHFFCLALLSGGSLNGVEILSSQTIETAFKNHNASFLAPRALGWDIHSGRDEYSSCGKLMPIGAVGHLGFTGTSLWMDPDSKIIIIILSNRVNLGREESLPLMRSFRPQIHNLLLSSYKQL